MQVLACAEMVKVKESRNRVTISSQFAQDSGTSKLRVRTPETDMVLGKLGWVVTLSEVIVDSDCYSRCLEDSLGQAPTRTGVKASPQSPPSHPQPQARPRMGLTFLSPSLQLQFLS